MRASWNMLLSFSFGLMMISLLGNSAGMFLGNFTNSHKTIIQISPLLFVPFIILAGFICNTSKIFKKVF